jgi:hypothetical protein
MAQIRLPATIGLGLTFDTHYSISLEILGLYLIIQVTILLTFLELVKLAHYKLVGFYTQRKWCFSANQNLTFVGKPNNGTISNTVGADQLLLAGNPYPSALDADKFINDINTIANTDSILLLTELYISGNNTI